MEGGRRTSSVENRRKGKRGDYHTSEHQRQQFVNSRLAALENDEHPLEVDNSDEEFHIEEEFEDEVKDEEVEVNVTAALKKSKRPKKKAVKRVVVAKRKTRGMERRGPKPFMQLLEEADLDRLPPHVPSYFTSAAKPSRYPPRKLCDVSGLPAKYKDPASKMKYLGMREYNTIQSMPTAALHAMR